MDALMYQEPMEFFGPFRNDWIWLWIQLCVRCLYVPRVSDERIEPQSESKVEAVVSKRAIVLFQSYLNTFS